MKNKNLLQSAKGQNCTLRLDGVCNFNTETVVFHHINIHATKDDLIGCDCCSNCHTKIHSAPYKHDSDLLRAMIETLKRRYNDGLIKA